MCVIEVEKHTQNGVCQISQTHKIKGLSTEDLLESMRLGDSTIIDVRSVNAYNGWRERDEERGGHIRSARSLPAKWTNYIDWIEIVRSKHILPEQSLILYGYDQGETERVANLFHRAGYQNIELYHRFVEEYCPDKDHPLEYLIKYRHLVSAEWLHGLITTGGAQEYNNARHLVCHAHYQNPEDYAQGHIPGAVELDTNLLESDKTWNRRSPGELRRAFEQLGITADTTVVLYGRYSSPNNNDPFPGSSAGHLGAIRCAFIMLYAGISDVRILNGGLQAWIDAGFEITQKTTAGTPINDFGADIPQQPELAVDLEQAQAMLNDKQSNLVSIRSWREIIGETSGYNYIEKKGRIPGSVWADNGSDAYHMENYRNLDHTMREYHEVEEAWSKLGITPDKHNAYYCGTGWRGSEAFFNAWLMGWPQVSVFDGGWFEWSNNNLPFETGIPDGVKQ